MTHPNAHKGAITEAIKCLKRCKSLAETLNAKGLIEDSNESLQKLQALTNAVQEIDEEHKDHKWFKHGDGMKEFYHSDAVIREIEGAKAKLLKEAVE